MGKILIIAVLFYFCFVQVYAAYPHHAADCDHLKEIDILAADNKVYRYDLRALSSFTSPDFYCDDNRGYRYILGVCLTTHMTCSGRDALATQFIRTPNGMQCAAVLAVGDHVGWQLIDPKSPNKGIKITHTNGDVCSFDNAPRTTIIYLECNYGIFAETKFYSCPEGPTCVYHLHLKTPHGCPKDSFASTVYNPGDMVLGNQYLSQTQIDHHAQQTAGLAVNNMQSPGQPPQPGVPNGPLPITMQGVNIPTYVPGKFDLSGHHIISHQTHILVSLFKLIIILYCGFIFYLIGGTYYNMKVNHLSGSDAIPHIKFWREVPALCQDGCGILHKITAGIVNLGTIIFSPLCKSAGLNMPSNNTSFPSKAGYTTM